MQLGSSTWITWLLLLLSLLVMPPASTLSDFSRVPAQPEQDEPLRWDVPCAESPRASRKVAGCHVGADGCRRTLVDSFITADERQRLLALAERAMIGQPATGGPTIADVNSGYVLGPAGLLNLYEQQDDQAFSATAAEYETYRKVVERIKQRVQLEFGLEILHFTAPTFVTRLVGNSSWTPATVHDEYYHTHVDKDNTDHYDYSGLLYLSEFGEDFTGGLLSFFGQQRGDRGPTELEVEPRPGRLVIFSSGAENPHRVGKVESGMRHTLSFWFTCDEGRRFQNFLDGKAHLRYGSSSSDDL